MPLPGRMSIELDSSAPAPLAEITGTEPSAAGMFTVLGILIVLLPACMSLNWDSNSGQTRNTTNSGP